MLIYILNLLPHFEPDLYFSFKIHLYVGQKVKYNPAFICNRAPIAWRRRRLSPSHGVITKIVGICCNKFVTVKRSKDSGQLQTRGFSLFLEYHEHLCAAPVSIQLLSSVVLYLRLFPSNDSETIARIPQSNNQHFHNSLSRWTAWATKMSPKFVPRILR
jgi:hypothetical protein